MFLCAKIQNASKANKTEASANVNVEEVCPVEKEETPSPIQVATPPPPTEKVPKKKTPKNVKTPKPPKVPKPPKHPKPPKTPKVKGEGKKKGKKAKESPPPAIPNLDLLEAHTKEALTKIETPKKGKVCPGVMVILS